MDEKLWKIRTMIFDGAEEDKEIAIEWLKQLIGEQNAKANLFILNFYKDWDDDKDIVIDPENCCRMRFKTFPIRFGKDYMYTVDMMAMYEGQIVFEASNEYSRTRVGEGWPKWDFCDGICKKLREKGIEFYQGLFHNTPVTEKA